MVDLKIRAVKLPKYCPRCRRADRFNALNDSCGRCDNILFGEFRRDGKRRKILPTLWQPVNYDASSEAVVAVLIAAVIFSVAQTPFFMKHMQQAQGSPPTEPPDPGF